MALHPIKLPSEARDLRRVVALQRVLLKSLSCLPLSSYQIDEAWLRGIWPSQSVDWIHKFCRVEKFTVLEPIRIIALAPISFRQSLYIEFCRQNRVAKRFSSGGDFRTLSSLDQATPGLVDAVERLFKRFYMFLGHKSNCNWFGYEFGNGRSVCKESYKTSFRVANEAFMSVCPYCDGSNNSPELDHYFALSLLPLLACSPKNLVPVCHHCNDVTHAKGNRPAMTIGAGRPTEDWLHPFFRSASLDVKIELRGDPKMSIPILHSPDPAELRRLGNHANLIKTLSNRWTQQVTRYFDTLVNRVVEKMKRPGEDFDLIVGDYLEDQRRGIEPEAMVKTAVCRAILDRRPEYRIEFEDANPVCME